MTFTEFARSHGLIINHIEHDKWVRVPTIDHPHKKNGAYFCGGEYGHVQDWANMSSVENWSDGKERTPAQSVALDSRIAESKRLNDSAQAELQAIAAKKANWILAQCELDLHLYLAKKGWPEAVGNVWRRKDSEPLLVIPMRYRGAICAVQLISPSGEKKFLKNQRCKDAEFTIGSGGVHIYCEGYITGLSLMEAVAALKIAATIHVCLSAGNVARLATRGFVVTDNDELKAGERSAVATGLPWWMPPEVGQDFNDYHRSVGLFSASQTLRKFLIDSKLNRS